MGLWGRALRGGIWIQSWKKRRREQSRYLSAKNRNRRVTHRTVSRLGWLEGNEQRWGGGQTIQGAGASLGQPPRLLWELGLLLWITWRHSALEWTGLGSCVNREPRLQEQWAVFCYGFSCWLHPEQIRWSQHNHPKEAHSADTGSVSWATCHHRLNETQLKDKVGALHEEISILLSMLSSWVKTRLAKRKFGSQNSVHLPG